MRRAFLHRIAHLMRLNRCRIVWNNWGMLLKCDGCGKVENYVKWGSTFDGRQ